MGDSQIRVGPSRNVANNRASLESELLARVEVGNHDGRLELRDTRDGHGQLLLGVVVILVGLVVNLGEKLGGDTRAALQRSELGMIDRNLEGIFSAKRSEEHTSELQSRLHLVCRLLLEKKKRLFP